MTTPHMLRTIFTGLLATVLFGIGIAPAHAQTVPEEIIFALSPAVTQDHPDDRVSVRAELEPGDSYTDALTLRNFTDAAVTFQLTAADGVTSDSGAFDVLAPEADSQGAGTWFELEQETVTVEADSTQTIEFRVAVPDRATPGDHPAGITAALADQDDDLNVVSRVGVRTHLRVAGDIEPALVFDHVETHYAPSLNPFAPGSLTANYSMTNTGNVRLGAVSTVASSGIFGWNFTTSEAAEVREILPGDTVSFQTTVDEVWPLVFGSVALEASPRMVGDDEFDVALVSTTHQESVALVSWAWVGLLAIVIAALVVALSQRKRRTKKFEAAVAQAAKQQVARQPDPVASRRDAR